MNIEFLEIEQVWPNETTRYWFDVDGEMYGIADQNGELSLLDSEGHPIEACDDHSGVKAALLPHYAEQVDTLSF